MVAPIQFDAGPLDSALEITSEFARRRGWDGRCGESEARRWRGSDSRNNYGQPGQAGAAALAPGALSTAIDQAIGIAMKVRK